MLEDVCSCFLKASDDVITSSTKISLRAAQSLSAEPFTSVSQNTSTVICPVPPFAHSGGSFPIRKYSKALVEVIARLESTSLKGRYICSLTHNKQAVYVCATGNQSRHLITTKSN